MTKAQIIESVVGAMKFDDEPDYREIVVAELNRKLPTGVDIRTCEDFRHLAIECCDTCHNLYPHYEMKVIQLPDGSPAWVCDTVEWPIYPERYQALKDWSKNSPEGKLLRKIFGDDVDE